MAVEIKNRWTGEVIFTWEGDAEVTGLSYGERLGRAVLEAIKAKANLSGANLSGAYLSGAALDEYDRRTGQGEYRDER